MRKPEDKIRHCIDKIGHRKELQKNQLQYRKPQVLRDPFSNMPGNTMANLMTDDRGDLSIGPEMVEQPRKNDNLATRKAEGIDVAVPDNQDLPIQSFQVLDRVPASLALLAALVDPLVVKNLILPAPFFFSFPFLTAQCENSVTGALGGGQVAGEVGFGGVLHVAPAALVVAEAALKGVDDLLGDEADADAVGVEGGEDLAAEGGLELLELGLAELSLDGGGEEDEVVSLRVGNGLEIAVVDGDGDATAEDGDEEDGPGFLVPAGATAAAEVLERAVVHVVVVVVPPPAAAAGAGAGGKGGVEDSGEGRGERRRRERISESIGSRGWGLGKRISITVDERGEGGLFFPEKIHSFVYFC